jgi:hypothetical protein
MESSEYPQETVIQLLGSNKAAPRRVPSLFPPTLEVGRDTCCNQAIYATALREADNECNGD